MTRRARNQWLKGLFEPQGRGASNELLTPGFGWAAGEKNAKYAKKNEKLPVNVY